MEDVIRLKRQNRILMLVGLVLFLLCFLAIGFIAWKLTKISHITARQEPNIISAKQFNLIDEKGRLHGVMAAMSDGSVLFLKGANGKTGMMFSVSAHGTILQLLSANEDQEIGLNVADALSWMKIGSTASKQGRIEMSSAAGSQNISISDSEGFKAVVGSTSLINSQTGQSTNTSAATVTLFAKDGRIISMVPRP